MSQNRPTVTHEILPVNFAYNYKLLSISCVQSRHASHKRVRVNLPVKGALIQRQYQWELR